MFRILLLILAVASPLQAAPIPLNGHNFTLPPGFEIDLVAGPDLVQRLISAIFDDKGNLYVTEASGTNDPLKKQIIDKPHRVRKLIDTNGDGKYDRSTVFAEHLMLPQGIMWLNGSIYVGNPPEITKLTDTDNDGKADQREVWFDGKTLTGCGNDLHGPYLGPDGWIYWTKGAFAEQQYTLPNGKPFKTRACHIFRAKPDCTAVEPVMTGGMDNPVEVAFTPTGEIFFTCTFLQHPANGLRDGIIHATYGGVYGKDHDPLYDHIWTRPTLNEPMTHLGAAAACGLHCYQRESLGKEFTNNLFSTSFNMQKVTRHILVPHGSTYRTTDSDFVVSDNHDFHPTDVLEHADGSLLVVDTGGWYKLCCPTSQLVKPDVLGGIYRIRRTGVKPVITKQPVPKLVDYTKHKPMPELLNDLKSDSLFVRRHAAESLGRIGEASAVPAILEAVADPKTDVVLDTALTRALIDIGEAKALAAVPHDAPARVKRAVFAALENMPNSGLTAARILPELTSTDAALRETAWWIAGRHPQWGGELATLFKEKLDAKSLNDKDRAEIAAQLAKFARSPIIQQFLAERIGDAHTPAGIRIMAMQAASQARLRTTPNEWYAAASAVLTGSEGEVPLIIAAIDMLHALPVPKTATKEYSATLHALARNPRFPAPLRFQALTVIPGGPGSLEAPLVEELLKSVHRDQPIATRSAAADVLSKIKLPPGQLLQLVEALKTATPMELDRLLEPFARSTDEKVGLALLASLKDSPLRSSLRIDMLKPRLAKYSPAVHAQAEALYTGINAQLAGQMAKVGALLAELKNGDVRRGQLVFNSQKAACISCHSMGYLGGKVGPDLTHIGRVRVARDLLEAIVVPSASFVRSYEPVKVTTLDGRAFLGLLKKDAPDEVVLTISATEEKRIARQDIDEIIPGTVSVMPNGLDQQLSKQDLADLVAFLLASK